MARVSISRQNSPNQGSYIYSPVVAVVQHRNAVLGDTHVFSPGGGERVSFRLQPRQQLRATATEGAAGERFRRQSRTGVRDRSRVSQRELEYVFGPDPWRQLRNFPVSAAPKPIMAFENSFQYADNVSIVHGAHTFKTGVDIRRFRFDRLLSVPTSGNYYFGATYTANPSLSQPGGLPYADYLLGLPTTVTNSNAVDWSRQRDLYFGPVYSGRLEDNSSSHSEPRLPLRSVHPAGGRAEYRRNVQIRTPPTAPAGSGIHQLPGQNGNSRAIVQGHHRNLAPRFGFALAGDAEAGDARRLGHVLQPTASRTIKPPTWRISLLEFPQHQHASGVGRRPPSSPPYRFNSPLIVSGRCPIRNSTQLHQGLVRLAPTSDRSMRRISGSRSSRCCSNSISRCNMSCCPICWWKASYAGARGVHWVQRIDLNQVPFHNASARARTRKPTGPSISSPAARASTAEREQLVQLRQPQDRAALFARSGAAANYTISHATDSGRRRHQHLWQPGQHARDEHLQPEAGARALSARYPAETGPQRQLRNSRSEPGKSLNIRNRVLNQVIGGWQTERHPDRSFRLATDVTTAALPPVFGTINRPDRVSGQPMLVANPGFDQYFNPAAFADPADGAEFQRSADPDVRKREPHGAARSGPAKPGFLDLQGLRSGRRSAWNFVPNPSICRTRRTSIYPARPARRSPWATRASANWASSQTVGRQLQGGLKLVW